MVTNVETKKINLSKFLVIIDRFSAWVLLVVMITYGITGYGLTKGLISLDLAQTLHLSWLGGIGLMAFVIHTSWAIHLALKRHNVWNSFTQIVLAAFYIILVLFFFWVHFFYQAPNNNGDQLTVINGSEATTVFTAETIRAYNGLSGQPAYIAVSGVVYDVSSLFINGNHYGYRAGQDLTAAFYSQHSTAFLRGLQIVGTYK
jgi:predicted heme/steroid binding protein